MAWTAPMTAVVGSPFTAAQFNTHVRDNLMETAPAKATQSGSFFVGAGPNQIVERVPDFERIGGVQSTSSTSYVDLATAGPTVTLQTGAFAIVFLNAHASQSLNDASCFASVEVSGATEVAASDHTALQHDLGNHINGERQGIAYVQELNPGLNTFRVKYRVRIGTGTWRRRELAILPF